MNVSIRAMKISDYNQMLELWKNCEGIGLSRADSYEGVQRFLERNPDSSFIAVDGEQVVATILAGHDGRRGYLHHVAVAENYRRRGIGEALVEKSLNQFRKMGIQKCHLFVGERNEAALRFWKLTGWVEREELIMFSRNIGK
ncbi:MAG TPA: GNAT family N-acetyltransferase [Levilinea sp.]|nr:GNAT family N-acetyltransferase [Levilinea sp.]